jgi:hypothetical protein
VAHAVKEQLSHLMVDFGYEIIAALVVDVIPDRTVKAAMNEINGKYIQSETRHNNSFISISDS